VLIKAFGKIKKKTVFFFLLNLCVNHSVLSFFSFLCENLLLKNVYKVREIPVFFCVNLIDPFHSLPTTDQLRSDLLLAKPEASHAVSLNTSSCLSASPSASSTSTGYSTASSAAAAAADLAPLLQQLLATTSAKRLPLATRTLDEIESEIMAARDG
jgi:hypothetical protein